MQTLPAIPEKAPFYPIKFTSSDSNFYWLSELW